MTDEQRATLKARAHHHLPDVHTDRFTDEVLEIWRTLGRERAAGTSLTDALSTALLLSD